MLQESYVINERQHQIDLYTQELENKELYEKNIVNYKKLLKESEINLEECKKTLKLIENNYNSLNKNG